MQPQPLNIHAVPVFVFALQVGEGGHSYLLTWPGTNDTLRPVLFIRCARCGNV